ncbi:MAG: gliding motility-associated C-terminal domain-containing protein [Muribaculaceae bacterium]|nr:gliding motility-associated C-terminal domain-containing protein [Muribaculaceae bacterium]
MKRLLSTIIFFLALAARAAASLGFAGNVLPVIDVAPAASTGLEAIYVLSSTDGVRVASPYPSSTWQIFGSMGGAYAEVLGPASDELILGSGDTGILIVDDSGRQHCFWIVDYAAHELELRSLAPVEGQADCDRVALALDGAAEAIPFYTITGRRETLSRELLLEYDSQEFDKDAFVYRDIKSEVKLDGAGSVFGAPAPLRDTRFTLTGDRFLRRWGRELSVSSDEFRTSAVACESRAEQTERNVDNEQKEDSAEGLGGSAPCEVNFSAAVSSGVVFREWQISRTADFEIPENSFNEDSFTYTFDEKGTFYVRLMVNNEGGTCAVASEVYEVFIGESRLDIPNAFSPNASPGVNDEWKVSYRSLVEFECHIFNRWGTRMCSFTDPSQGWDGKYGGKFVPAGTYYYVIKARGADGVEYKRSGDINIINFREGSGTSGSQENQGAQ